MGVMGEGTLMLIVMVGGMMLVSAFFAVLPVVLIVWAVKSSKKNAEKVRQENLELAMQYKKERLDIMQQQREYIAYKCSFCGMINHIKKGDACVCSSCGAPLVNEVDE